MGRWKIAPLLALLFVIGCGPSDEGGVSPNGDPGGTFYALAVLNRFGPGFDAEMARGKDLYVKNCAICHGKSGDGRGFNAYNLKSNFGVQPFNFTDADAAGRMRLDEVGRAVTLGGRAVNKSQYMPAWGSTFSEYDLACVTYYVWHSLMKR